MAEVEVKAEVTTEPERMEKVPFAVFGEAVFQQFNSMIANGLFRVQLEKELLWQMYLGSFPAGSDPMYKKRTEHDCQSCRHFIRTVGGVVTVIDGKLVSIWDVQIGGYYQVVADAMSELVKVCPIDNIFLSTDKNIGMPKNRQILESGDILTWEHFHVEVPNQYMSAGVDIGPKTSLARSTHDVMLRSLQELKLGAINQVLELIDQNSLLRGTENRFAVDAFRVLKEEFDKLTTPLDKDLFCWSRLANTIGSVSGIRNTAIGTLLEDLSDGQKSLDASVNSFETKVGGANYKRPTALVTKAMIEKAHQTIKEMGLESALDRRFATIDDITINNILFANREAKKAMNVFEQLAAKVPEKIPNLDKIETVTIEDFLANILPKAESVEIMFENRHASNLVSLIAPVDPESKNMFKWPNKFSWSYTGEMADSIKERVKKAGGVVVGDLCCRLAWDYEDDLDFHMKEPGKYEIYYPNRRTPSPNGGILDIDANGADGQVANPAENIYYTSRQKMRDGTYTLEVHNYSRRSDGVGFEVEVEFDGRPHHIVYPKVLRSKETVTVAKIEYTKANGFKILESLPTTTASKTIWNVPTQTYHKVNVVMLSPNHWDGHGVGNKHYFFMMEGCLNDGKARGFYNEFLTQELDVHRKVFEVVGSHMKTEESDRQLTGLGFSSTQRNDILCRVGGSFSRVVKITF